MPTNNLNPEQRKLVRRARRVLAMLPDPERRVLVGTLKALWDIGMAPVLADVERRKAWIERRMAEEHAVILALEERLGREPQDGEDITLSDELRAQEILALYPKAGGE